MKTLKRFISEAKNKPVVFAFGRFNPPTTGHAKLVDVLNRLAKKVGGDAMVFTSHSNDKKKNPLNHKQKVNYLRKFFGKKVKVQMSVQELYLKSQTHYTVKGIEVSIWLQVQIESESSMHY